MSDKHIITMTIPAISDYISVVRVAVSGVAARLQFTVDEIEDIKVAVSEACTNVIQHAYEDAVGNIHIQCELDEEELTILVKDTGKGFDPKTLSSKKVEDNGEGTFGLGLGLTFIKSLMDDTDVQSSVGQGCTVTMVKRLSKVNA